jgi:tetratricopeptide (TPR) repeat protein
MRRRVASFALALAATLAVRSASACIQDDETYVAEAKSMPCILDALTGAFPEHGPEFYAARLRAADAALAVTPTWLEGLDMKGVALLRTGRLAEAEAVMLERARIAPDAYASHANLGTLYTFTGDYDKALAHVDAALAKDPQAHFGREKYHRMLIVYLAAAKADPNVRKQRSFLVPKDLTTAQRFRAEGGLASVGLDDSAIDAVIAMITVYGAKALADVYYAAGDVLALRGKKLLAWTAYQRAIELGHPRQAELKSWNEGLAKSITTPPTATPKIYVDQMAYAKVLAHEYASWERAQIQGGLPVWTAAGLTALYAFQNDARRRCSAPGLADERFYDPPKAVTP